MKSTRKRVLLVLAISFVMLFSTAYFVNVLFVPNTSDVLIVEVGDDDATDTTSDTIEDKLEDRNDKVTKSDGKDEKLKSNPLASLYATSSVKLGLMQDLDNAILDVDRIKVSIEDLEKDALTNRHARVLIIVGHGNSDGLEDDSDEMDWSDVKALIAKSGASFSILTCCYSDKAADDLPNAFGFQGVVDGVLAAYITAAIVFKLIGDSASSNGAMDLAAGRFGAILNDPEIFMALALGSKELIYWITQFIINVILCVVGKFPGFSTTVSKILSKALQDFGLKFIDACIKYCKGQISWRDFKNAVYKFGKETIASLLWALKKLSWWQWVIWGAALVASILLTLFPVGFWVKLVLWAAKFASMAYLCYLDYKDADDVHR